MIDTRRNGHGHPSTRFLDLSRPLLHYIPKSFIVVDALDKCQVSEGCRKIFLAGLFNVQAKCGANIFATSWPISSIEKEFEGSQMLEIRASDEDVRRCLYGHMFRLPGFVARSLEL